MPSYLAKNSSNVVSYQAFKVGGGIDIFIVPGME